MTTRESKQQVLLQQVAALRSAVAETKDVSALELEEIEARLADDRYLIAVFGAFSAGKSSLLNALLGEPLLTVSPNPTTASVTQLTKVIDEETEVQVTAKTEAELWRDVESAFAALHEYPPTLREGIMRAAALNPRDFPTSLRRHIRFLKAIHDGYEEMSSRLGTTWTTTRENLQSFSATEKYAAYVARVDVYAEDPWLNRGFIFVDTPGVDSIHRRHTDVAFRYMRHADAVIFVMYYSHAFTQGDRDFLLQLSGVQDVAQTNKLFTVINAVDLAKSEEERTAVRERVHEELRRLGIRFPRVFEVSAQIALAARQLRDNPDDEVMQTVARQRLQLPAETSLPSVDELLKLSGIQALEDDLRNYVETEGISLATDMVKRVQTQLVSSVAQLIKEETSRQFADDLAQAQRRTQLQEIADRIAREANEQLSNPDRSPALSGIKGQLDELAFHATERIRLRYRDLFRASFNPSRFRVGKASDKLREAAEELCEALSRQIDIETRTLSLRAAHLAEKSLAETADSWLKVFTSAAIQGVTRPAEDFSSVIVEGLQSKVSADTIQPFLKYFSSPRQFFEGGGAKEMLDASEEAMMQTVRKTFMHHASPVIEHAAAALEESMRCFFESLEDAVQRAHERAARAFDAAQLDLLKAAKHKLEQIVVS